MKVFFDEDVPRKLARSLTQHEIHSVVSMQWGGIKNVLTPSALERCDDPVDWLRREIETALANQAQYRAADAGGVRLRNT